MADRSPCNWLAGVSVLELIAQFQELPHCRYRCSLPVENHSTDAALRREPGDFVAGATRDREKVGTIRVE